MLHVSCCTFVPYVAIGDTISCDAPYSAIGFRGELFLRLPPASKAIFMERSGGVVEIVCDTTGNTVRQGIATLVSR